MFIRLETINIKPPTVTRHIISRLTTIICERSIEFDKPPLAIAKAALCVGAVHLFVCLSFAKMRRQKRDFSQKLSNLEPWSLLTTYIGVSKKPIIRPLKFRMAEIRHLENREVAISQRKKNIRFR